MREWIFFACVSVSLTANGQNINSKLEISVIRETLPQLLNGNPNSAACYLKNGRLYKLMSEVLHSNTGQDTSALHQARLELDKLSDSLSEVLTKEKIVVLISDTLFAYRYSPTISKYKDGHSDTTDLKIPENWDYEKNNLIETFQTDYEKRGFKNPIDIKFIDLGLCTTPEEEMEMYEDDEEMEDFIRLKKLKEVMINKVRKDYPSSKITELDKIQIKITEELDKIQIKSPEGNCRRKRNLWQVKNIEEFEVHVNYILDKLKYKRGKLREDLLNLLSIFLEGNLSLISEEKLEKIKSQVTPEPPKSKDPPPEYKIVWNEEDYKKEFNRIIEMIKNSKSEKEKDNFIVNLYDFLIGNKSFVGNSMRKIVYNQVLQNAKLEPLIFNKYIEKFEHIIN